MMVDIERHDNELHFSCPQCGEYLGVSYEYLEERTCKMYRDEHGTWHCESCENGGDNITGSDGVLDMWYDSWHPNYCPWCGAKVID